MKRSAILFFAAASPFAMVAFIMWSFDPEPWSQFCRAITVYVGVASALITLLWMHRP
jgi:hypothetical protein